MSKLFKRHPQIFCNRNHRTIKQKRDIASLAIQLRRKPLQSFPLDGKKGSGVIHNAGIAHQTRCFKSSPGCQELLSRVNSLLPAATTDTNSTLEPFSKTSIPETLPPSSQSPATIILIDNKRALKDMLLKMQDLPVKQPSLFIDAEGNNLGRTGSLALLQILVAPLKCIFVVDIHVLKSAAFTTCASDSTLTLKGILESDEIPKVIFDVRNDSDNLFAEYGICLGGVRDLQLMEYFSRPREPGFTLLGLAKCIEKHLHATPDVIEKWKSQKEKGKILFSPRFGGSHEVFFNRPLSSSMLAYAAGDVEHMSTLYLKYRRKLPPSRWKWVLEKSRKRVKTSHIPAFALEHDRRWVAPSWTGRWNHDGEVFVSNGTQVKSTLATASSLPNTSLPKTPQNKASTFVTTTSPTIKPLPQKPQHHSTIKESAD
jgi:exonuclease 3'-5' domain-containing protein 1